MAFEILETHELVKTISLLPPVNSYWLDLCFPDVHLSNSEFIDFDIVDSAKRLAPFVAPTVQGQPMVSRGHSVRKFKPAYVKPKDPVDPARLLKRRAGEMFGAYANGVTPAAREDAIIADILNDHRTGIERRWEWMAARAIIDGAVLIEGENYPRVQLSFGRDAGLTKSLGAGARWNEGTSDPLADIEAWGLEMMQKSGYPPTRITFGTAAWQAFASHAKTQKMLETLRGSENRFETGPGNAQPIQYRGRMASAALDMYVYSDYYEDNTGAQVQMMSPNDIVMTGAGVEGVRAFGAIMDRRANWEALPMFPKMWEQEDPSGLFIMTQSAPLMIPGRPNNTLRATVRV